MKKIRLTGEVFGEAPDEMDAHTKAYGEHIDKIDELDRCGGSVIKSQSGILWCNHCGATNLERKQIISINGNRPATKTYGYLQIPHEEVDDESI